MKTKLALTLFLTAAGFLGGASPGQSNASGCSWYQGSPGYGGCRPGGGSCYECEYSYGSAHTKCWENADGSVSYCIDYQDIQP
jgi:hypothetical protein